MYQEEFTNCFFSLLLKLEKLLILEKITNLDFYVHSIFGFKIKKTFYDAKKGYSKIFKLFHCQKINSSTSLNLINEKV